MLGCFCLELRVIVRHIDPNGIENTNEVRIPYFIGIK